MTTYKTSAITLISMLALTGCPSDDTAGGDTESGSDTDPTTSMTGPTTDPMTESGTTTGTDTDPDTTDTDPDTTDTDTDTDTDTAGSEAVIRVIHASPGAPAVDVYVMGDDTPVIENLAYGATSDYLPVPPGDYTFEIRATGEAADSEPAYTTDALTLAEGDSISAIAAGLLGGEGEAAFRVLALADTLDEGGDDALVRVVHAGSDAPTVGIDVGNDGTVELADVARYADSGADSVPLPADTALQIGIAAEGETVTAFTTPELPAGAPLYVIATGLLADLPRQETGFSLLAVGPDGSIGFIQQNPRVYALHAGSDAPNVDICVDGTALLPDVPYGAMGGVQVIPGVYGLDIHVADVDDPCAGTLAFEVDTPEVAAGQQYLAVAAGELESEDGEPGFGVSFFAEEFGLDNDAGDAVARIVHAAAAPDVNVGLVDTVDDTTFPAANVLVTGLAHGESNSRDVLVTPDSIIAGIGAAADNTPPYDVIANFELATPDGIRAWVVATGSLAPDGDEAPFALHAVVTGAGPWALLGPIAPSGPS